jgi:hypothetical protein
MTRSGAEGTKGEGEACSRGIVKDLLSPSWLACLLPAEAAIHDPSQRTWRCGMGHHAQVICIARWVKQHLLGCDEDWLVLYCMSTMMYWRLPHPCRRAGGIQEPHCSHKQGIQQHS